MSCWSKKGTSGRSMFQSMLGQGEAPGNAGLTAVSPPPAWPGCRPLAVTTTERESESVVSVYLADPGGAAVPPAQRSRASLPRGPLPRSRSCTQMPNAKCGQRSVKSPARSGP